jgi:hypothetical protein
MKHATITEATLLGDTDSMSAAEPSGRPIHEMLVSFSAAYFAGALVTDFVYWQIPEVLWEIFSIWLIVAGLIMAGLATIAYAIDLAGGRQIDRPAWPRVVGYALAGSLRRRILPRRRFSTSSADGQAALVIVWLRYGADRDKSYF